MYEIYSNLLILFFIVHSYFIIYLIPNLKLKHKKENI